jgi:O-antigen/teichoic acid export membrane protein
VIGTAAVGCRSRHCRGQLQGETNFSGMGKFHFSATKSILLLGFSVFGYLHTSGHQLMRGWVEDRYGPSARVPCTLVPGFYAGAPSAVTWCHLVEGGAPGVRVLVSVFETALAMGAAVVLTKMYGVMDAALGTSIPACLSLPVCLWLALRQARYPLPRLVWEGVAFPLALCVGLALSGLCPSRFGQFVCLILCILTSHATFVGLGVVGWDTQRQVRECVGAQRPRLLAGGEV